MKRHPSQRSEPSIWRGNWGIGAPHSGSYAKAISNHAYGVVQSEQLTVQPSTAYHLSAWLRGEIAGEESAGQWVLRARYYDANHTYLSQSNADQRSTAPASWTEKGSDLTTPANAAYPSAGSGQACGCSCTTL